MNFYITPTGRVYQRRNWEKNMNDGLRNEVEYDVLVPVNVKAEDESYIIKALVPGVKAEDLSIQVHNETLTIQGVLAETETETNQFMVREIPVGRFHRVIHLPEPLDSGKAVADLTDGVLTLRVPKAEEARPKMIKVMAN